MPYYNKRTCEHCGNEFRPGLANQVECSIQCTLERCRYRSAQRKSRIVSINQMVEWLNSELENAREIIRAMLDERSALKAEIARLTESGMRLSGEKFELQGKVFFEDVIAPANRKIAAND